MKLGVVGSALIGLLVCSFVDAACEPVDWTRLNFAGLEGTPSGLTVETAVRGLRHGTDSPFLRYEAQGDTWACITEVLALLAKAQELAEREDLSAQPLQKYQMYHSGRTWRFWYDVARVRVAAFEFGQPEMLSADARRVLEQMQAAFAPLLAP